MIWLKIDLLFVYIERFLFNFLLYQYIFYQFLLLENKLDTLLYNENFITKFDKKL